MLSLTLFFNNKIKVLDANLYFLSSHSPTHFLFQVGIGNVWRFPYLAYKNGGAVFLIPYFILLIFVGKPMYYLETAIGQFARLSPLQVWRCAPIAKGVGFGMIVLSLIVSIYYNVIMAYSIIYIGASFVGINGELPWTNCGKFPGY